MENSSDAGQWMLLRNIYHPPHPWSWPWAVNFIWWPHKLDGKPTILIINFTGKSSEELVIYQIMGFLVNGGRSIETHYKTPLQKGLFSLTKWALYLGLLTIEPNQATSSGHNNLLLVLVTNIRGLAKVYRLLVTSPYMHHFQLH